MIKFGEIIDGLQRICTLSIGSAAGVALMGASKGQCTFMSHLKWTPVIALGYAAGVATHLGMNG